MRFESMSIWWECEFNMNIMTISYNRWLIWMHFQFANYYFILSIFVLTYFSLMSMRISAIFILYGTKSFSCNAMQLNWIRSHFDYSYYYWHGWRESTLDMRKWRNFNVCTPEIDTLLFYIRLHVQQYSNKNQNAIDLNLRIVLFLRFFMLVA